MSENPSFARIIVGLILAIVGAYLIYQGYSFYKIGDFTYAVGAIAGGTSLLILAFGKSFIFNVVSILIGLGFAYFGYMAYLSENWPIAFLGLVGGSTIILASFAFIILKLVVALNS